MAGRGVTGEVTESVDECLVWPGRRAAGAVARCGARRLRHATCAQCDGSLGTVSGGWWAGVGVGPRRDGLRREDAGTAPLRWSPRRLAAARPDS